jgi:hypothetical protein
LRRVVLASKWSGKPDWLKERGVRAYETKGMLTSNRHIGYLLPLLPAQEVAMPGFLIVVDVFVYSCWLLWKCPEQHSKIRSGSFGL